jgi:hypothetical protein
MTPLSHGDAELLPLSTDSEIESRVADLIGRANSRQLWLLFLDDADVQLPVLIPMDSLPSEPARGEVETIVDNLRELMHTIGASALITVLERYGAATLTDQDRLWIVSLRDCCERQSVRLRAQLLSHRGGVRWIGDDELVARPRSVTI